MIQTQETEGAHSLLSPSSAHRWVECPGSVAMSMGYPGKTSEHAEEGVRAHSMAERILHNGDFCGPVDADMMAEVQKYTDIIKAKLVSANYAWIEESLDLSTVYGVSNQKGTGDCIILRDDCRTLEVHDLKYGKGVVVEAEENWQLISYGLGAMELVSLLTDKLERVVLCIHQPRLNHYSEVVYTPKQMAWYRNQLRYAAERAMLLTEDSRESVEAHLNPGEKTCRWCLASAECPALRKNALMAVANDFEDLTKIDEGLKELPDPKTEVLTWTTSKLSQAVAMLPVLEIFVKAIKERSMEVLMNGGEIPGFKLVSGRRGNRVWVNEEEAEKELKSMRFRVDEMYKLKLISPADAEKLLKKTPRRWARVKDMITQGEGKPAVVPVSDERPALTLQARHTEFEDLTGKGE